MDQGIVGGTPKRAGIYVRVSTPPAGNFLDSALGTFDVENVLERMDVQPEETRPSPIHSGLRQLAHCRERLIHTIDSYYIKVNNLDYTWRSRVLAARHTRLEFRQ